MMLTTSKKDCQRHVTNSVRTSSIEVLDYLTIYAFSEYCVQHQDISEKLMSIHPVLSSHQLHNEFISYFIFVFYTKYYRVKLFFHSCWSSSTLYEAPIEFHRKYQKIVRRTKYMYVTWHTIQISLCSITFILNFFWCSE